MRANAGPATNAAAVSPNDSADLPGGVCAALFIGTGGNVNITAPGGGTALFKNLASGSILDVCAQRVLNTNTTATDIVALY